MGLFPGCSKDNTLKNENGQVVVQGIYTLKVQAKHHAWVVPDLPVYFKKNVTSWPGTDSTKYEFKATTDNNGNCEFTHLFPGSYYIYAHGLDINVNDFVIGYEGVTINSGTTTDNVLAKTLLVSE